MNNLIPLKREKRKMDCPYCGAIQSNEVMKFTLTIEDKCFSVVQCFHCLNSFLYNSDNKKTQKLIA